MNVRFNFRKRALLVLSMGLIMLFLVASCYRDYGLTVQDYDVVFTKYDTEADFTQFPKYAMPDTILHLVPEDQEDDLSRAFDAQILSEVARNMQAYGYERVTDTTQIEETDIIILVTASKSDWLVYNYYPGYWWGWYPWYPGGGWYPYYPGWGSVSSFSTGSIFITMLDRERTEPDNQVIVGYWGAAINGLLGDTASSTRGRIIDAIKQAFAQSEYLKIN